MGEAFSLKTKSIEVGTLFNMKFRLLFFALAWTLLACDNFSNDVLPTLNVRFETGQDIPFIINPSELVNGKVNTVNVLSDPMDGTLQLLSAEGFLRYTPPAGLSNGEDAFEISTQATDGSLRQIAVSIRINGNTCGYESIFDFVQLSRNESKVVDLFANDFFCNGPINLTETAFRKTVITSNFEDLNWVSFTLDEVQNEANLALDAPNVTGIAKIIYEIGINLKDGYEKFFAGGTTINPEAFENYIISEVTIEVID